MDKEVVFVDFVEVTSCKIDLGFPALCERTKYANITWLESMGCM